MNAYPPAYTSHCIPLLVLSGLESPHPKSPDSQESHFHSFPPIPEDICTQLRIQFIESDGSRMLWRESTGHREAGLLPFRIKLTDQSFALPPRKVSSSTEIEVSSSSRLSPHSPLSPLTPSSPTYPDILMVPEWLLRHQQELPPAFISFFYLKSDPALDVAFDNQLKDRILRAKAQLSTRIHYAVAVVSEKSVVEAPEIERRLSAICRASGLDDKSQLFFLPPKVSHVETARFVTTILRKIQPICQEYYRNLATHARMKRNRRSVPPIADESVTPLTSFDWSIRYDFKQAIFAEFCQDMERANTFYSAALRSLLGPDGVFTSTSLWKSRWSQSRLFADIIGIRIMKCFLWYNLTTAAVQFWTSYRDHIRLLLDNHAEGTSGYGWQAWEANWASVMADLITRAEIFPSITKPVPAVSAPDLRFAQFAPSEKSIPIQVPSLPWQRMHRPEYWYALSARHAAIRLQLAMSVSPDDRKKPTERTGREGRKSIKYRDLYFCLEPHEEYPLEGTDGFDHAGDISSRFLLAANGFYKTKQDRLGDHAQLRAAKHLYSGGQYRKAMDAVEPVWRHMKWRHDRWINLVFDVLLLTHECARLCSEHNILVAVRWELMNASLPRQNVSSYDLFSPLNQTLVQEATGDEEVEQVDSSPVSVRINSRNTLSFLSLSLVFDRIMTEVTRELKAQLVIHSNAQPDTNSITLSEVVIRSSGYVEEIRIAHKSQHSGSSRSIQHLDLAISEKRDHDEGPLYITSSADLSINPGERRVFEFGISPRRPGHWTVDSIESKVESDKIEILLISQDPILSPPVWSVLEPSGELRSMAMIRDSGLSVNISPRAPLLTLQFKGLLEKYYTDERISISCVAHNRELDEISGSLTAKLLDPHGLPVSVLWMSKIPTEEPERKPAMTGELINLSPGASSSEDIFFVAPSSYQRYVLELTAQYHLKSGPGIPIVQVSRLELSLIEPFHPQFKFSSGIHPSPWPSKQSDQDGPVSQMEISHVWYLHSILAPHSSSIIELGETELVLISNTSGIECAIQSNDKNSGAEASVGRSLEAYCRSFEMVLREMAPSARNPIPFDFSLRAKWKRRNSPTTDYAVTVMTVPRFMALPLDLRVLTSVKPHLNREDVIRNEYMLENPTGRPYNLTVTLAPNLSFRLGPNEYLTQAVHLPPLSRQPVVFTLTPKQPESRRLVVQVRVERKNEKLPPLYIWPTGDVRVNPEGLRLRW